ncbi:MAG: RNA polymerase sigma factor FliA [Betaproteobacteria bacterium]|nr:RNA polymerase sigma factor FliA [Betaproteobacteria bacterium]MDE1980985.1 RNA polymerase sigma factor FliA [Betaproteobacteria bacterium]MDE2131314.1 RNA polymerase sigma factor FliA [Betaproteobacteria bacterium]MDE2212481.1 RNA polymerase sigma factor FliA [Betaproteobacteria bacterium]
MYTPTGLNDKEQCLKEFAPLVKRIAHHLKAKLPGSVEVDDMIQAGMMGLLEAANRYDELRGAQFETYAAQRIRGAMLDELRQSDWLPRSMRRDMRRIEQAIHKLQQLLGKAPSESEIAAEMGMGLTDYQQMLFESRGAQLIYYEDFHEQDGDDGFFDRHDIGHDPDPLDMLRDSRFRNALIQAIEELPERERMLMGMHYEQEMNLREIGEVMGVSESRVCQLHSQAVARLRSRLKGH